MSNIINFKNKENTINTNDPGIIRLYNDIKLGLTNDVDILDSIKMLKSEKRCSALSKDSDALIDETIRQLHYRVGMIVPKHLMVKTPEGYIVKCPICSNLNMAIHNTIFCSNCGQKLEI